jgi:hypothetical protein
MTVHTTEDSHTIKAKGSRLQTKIARRIKQVFGLSDQDVQSQPMSVQGEDIILNSKAREILPYSIESKFRSNSKDFGCIYTFYEQATDQALDLALNADIAPIVFIQQYNKQVLAVFSEDDFWERENLIQNLRKELISYESI